MPGLEQTYQRLISLRADARAKRDAILDRCEREKRDRLTVDETRAFERLTAQISGEGGLDERIGEIAAEIKRSGRGDPDAEAVRKATANPTGGAGTTEQWAQTAARELRDNLGGRRQESRAVISGSVDIPNLVLPGVVPIPRPVRLIDLFSNREAVDSMAFEYFRATARREQRRTSSRPGD